MESANKSGKGKRNRYKNRALTHRALPKGKMFPGAKKPEEKLDISVTTQGQSALHVACLYGQLATIRSLVESNQSGINSCDLQGRGPVHMVLCSHSSPNTSLCLRYLMERGADINVKTDSGTTPLHLAASEGHLDCTEILVQAGADVMAQDRTGHTPLDLARIGCHRKVARYLKSCMWQEDKKKEMQERKLVQNLYRDLVGKAKLNELSKKTNTAEKISEWVKKKGLPPLKEFSPRISVSQYHTQCLPSDQTRSYSKPADHPLTPQQPPASSHGPWSVFMGLQTEKPPAVPDLRDSVVIRRDRNSSQLEYITKWDGTPHKAPDLPLDVLERVLFPGAFHSRITSSRHFEPHSITKVQHRGYPQGRSTSPWTEVAMHLSEVLRPRHF